MSAHIAGNRMPSCLAGDVVAAFDHPQARSDIDGARIGLLGVTQAGWIMPLAAIRAKGLAFLISISGAGVPAAETTIDHARRELTASGMRPDTIDAIVALMKQQYHFARTGEGWEAYAAARAKPAATIGSPPDAFPGTPEHPYFDTIRRLYLYDPAPTLRQLRVTGRKQRRNAVLAATRTGLFHDGTRLDRQARPRRRAATQVSSAVARRKVVVAAPDRQVCFARRLTPTVDSVSQKVETSRLHSLSMQR